MIFNPEYEAARQLLLDAAEIIDTEKVSLERSFGRVLAQQIVAEDNVPPFDRSPYDGYALRSEDVASASKESPVTLRIVEEVAAGAVSTIPCEKGTAVKILTGAPIPMGADCVVMYEKTKFDDSFVTIFSPLKYGENIVRMGDDVRKGTILAEVGQKIDTGVAGTLASQGVAEPIVYRRPKVGIISTGNEVTEPGEKLGGGKIYNSNRFIFASALDAIGCDSVYLGLSGDRPEDIAALIEKGLETCDAVLSTGGVSAGDYDFTPAAMEMAGVEILFRGVNIKPGMACACGSKNGKLYLGLSGNPASALTNFYAVVKPALLKMAGHKEYMPEIFSLKMTEAFGKKNKMTRFLRGKLVINNGEASIKLMGDQGNAVISSAIGCDVMAIVPPAFGAIEQGTILEGFMI